MIAVLLGVENALFRTTLAAVVASEPDLRVVGEVGHGRELQAAISAWAPDVAVVDADLPDTASLWGCAVVWLVRPRRPALVRRRLDSGVVGLISTETSPARLIDAIRRVARGEGIVDTDLAVAALAAVQSPLSARELEVLRLTAEGAAPPEIANRLYISQRTVRNYLSATRRKTGGRSRVDVIRIAEAAGWL